MSSKPEHAADWPDGAFVHNITFHVDIGNDGDTAEYVGILLCEDRKYEKVEVRGYINMPAPGDEEVQKAMYHTVSQAINRNANALIIAANIGRALGGRLRVEQALTILIAFNNDTAAVEQVDELLKLAGQDSMWEGEDFFNLRTTTEQFEQNWRLLANLNLPKPPNDIRAN